MNALGESGQSKDKKVVELRGTRKNPRWFRVRVTDQISGKIKVDIRLPVNVVKAGSKLGAKFSPEMSGLDMNQVMQFVNSGTTGRIFELTHDSDQELVEVFIE